MRPTSSRIYPALVALWLLAGLVLAPVASAQDAPDSPDPIQQAKNDLWKNGPPRGLAETPLLPLQESRGDVQASSPYTSTDTVIAPYLGWSRIAFQSYRDGNYEIYTAQPDGSDARRLTYDGDPDVTPRVNARRSAIVWVSKRDSSWELYSANLDGSAVRRLTRTSATESQPAWSPDGTQIAYSANLAGTWDIWVMNADGSNVHRVTSGGVDAAPAWSPDGSEIAFIRYGLSSWGSVISHVYRTKTDGSDLRLVSSRTLGLSDYTTWSPNGRYITVSYNQGSGPYGIMVFDLTAGPDFFYTVNSIPNLDSELWMGGWSPDSERLIYTIIFYEYFEGRTYLKEARLATTDRQNYQTYVLANRSGVDFSPDWYSMDFKAPITAVATLPAFSLASGFDVVVHGKDPGDAGLTAYDVEVRVNGGAWQPWQTLDGAKPSATYSGPARSQVGFRSRGRDRAGNVEQWRAEPDTGTRLYLDTMRGTVTDVRERPIPGAAVATSPPAIVQVAADKNGAYRAYLADTGALAAQASAPGYAAAAETQLPAGLNRNAYFTLPATDGYLAGGDFDAAVLDPAWQLQGDPLPARAYRAHTGEGSVALGQPAGFAPVEALGPGPLPYFTGRDDNLALVYTSVDRTELYLRRKAGAAPWSAPVLIQTRPEGIAAAIGALDSAGGLHLSVTPYDPYQPNTGLSQYCYLPSDSTNCRAAAIPGLGNSVIRMMIVDPADSLHLIISGSDLRTYYARRTKSGSWEVAEPAEGVSDPTSFAIDMEGRPHIVWSDIEQYGYFSTTYHTMRLADGVWTTPERVAGGGAQWSSPRIAIDPQDVLHVAWEIYDYPAGAVYYTSKKPGGRWTPSVRVSPSLRRLLFTANAHGVQLVGREDDANLVRYAIDERGAWKHDAGLTGNGRDLLLTLDGANALHVVSYDPVEWPQQLSYHGPARANAASAASLSQTVTIPADSHQPTLSFYVRREPTVAPDALDVTVQDGEISTQLPLTVTLGDWQHQWADMSAWAGKTVTLRFELQQAADAPVGQVWLDEITLGPWLTPAIESASISLDGLVTVTGDNFVGTPVLRVGDQELPSQLGGDGALTAQLASRPRPGVYIVWVTNPGGQAAAQDMRVGHALHLPAIPKGW